MGKVGSKPNVGQTVLYKLLYYIDFDFKIRTAMEFECLTSHLITAKYRVHSGQAGVQRRAEKADSQEDYRMRFDLRHVYAYPMHRGEPQ